MLTSETDPIGVICKLAQKQPKAEMQMELIKEALINSYTKQWKIDGQQDMIALQNIGSVIFKIFRSVD